MNLVAVVGKMHSGKSTLADALVTKGYQRIAFADPVKGVAALMLTSFVRYLLMHFEETCRAVGQNEIVCTDTHFTIDDLNRMKGHPSIRGLLQLVGTELGREWYGPDNVWIELFKKTVNQWKTFNPDVKIVCDDCRFPNEAEALREIGFKIVKLERNENKRMQSVWNAVLESNKDRDMDEIDAIYNKIMSHPSETNVDLITADYTVYSPDADHIRQIVASLVENDMLYSEETLELSLART